MVGGSPGASENVRAETPDQVRPMIEQALRHGGPALVEAIDSRQELSMPPSITIDQIKGFVNRQPVHPERRLQAWEQSRISRQPQTAMGNSRAITDVLCVWQSFAQIPRALKKWRRSSLPTSGCHIPHKTLASRM